MSARAALAQSMSFCTVGAPLTPIAPTSSPSTLIGRPPPYAATRASVGMPAKSDGSRWMKSKKSCVARRTAPCAAKGLEIAAVIEHGDVLGDANRSGLRHGFIHHPLCQLRRDAVLLDHVSHWTFSLSPIHLE